MAGGTGRVVSSSATLSFSALPLLPWGGWGGAGGNCPPRPYFPFPAPDKMLRCLGSRFSCPGMGDRSRSERR